MWLQEIETTLLTEKNSMKDKYFLDSNVLIYAHNNLDSLKQDKAQTLIERSIPTISTQVLNEFTNAFRKKFHVEWSFN